MAISQDRRITGHSRRNSCLPEIATGAKRPRNDKSGAIAILAIACANRQCGAGSGMPLPPYNKGTIDSAPQSQKEPPGGRLLPCPHQRTGIFGSVLRSQIAHQNDGDLGAGRGLLRGEVGLAVALGDTVDEALLHCHAMASAA